MNWKRFEKEWLLPVSRYYPVTHLEGLGWIARVLIENSRCLVLDSNQAPSRYTNQKPEPTCSVCAVWLCLHLQNINIEDSGMCKIVFQWKMPYICRCVVSSSVRQNMIENADPVYGMRSLTDSIPCLCRRPAVCACGCLLSAMAIVVHAGIANIGTDAKSGTKWCFGSQRWLHVVSVLTLATVW
jgi:hypothetical protein